MIIIMFNQLNFFPDPEKKPASDEFASCWGKSTSEKDRPSLASKKSTPAKSTAKVAKPFRMTAETACDMVVCGECLKPRCMYSKRKLTKFIEQIRLSLFYNRNVTPLRKSSHK